jgi:hypothetical protein
MNSEMVVSKLYETVDSTGRLDAQRLEQWLGVLRRRAAVEAFEALVGVFCNGSRPDSRYLDQEALLLSIVLIVGSTRARKSMALLATNCRAPGLLPIP